MTTTMDDPEIRQAVALYLEGTLTEAEAARRAGIPRALLREYARTSGIASLPDASATETGE